MEQIKVAFDFSKGIPIIPADVKRRVRAGKRVTIIIEVGSGFVKNALEHGVAGINVDGCRVGVERRVNPATSKQGTPCYGDFKGAPPRECTGRWPANVIHDGSEELLVGFPGMKGASSTGLNHVASKPYDHDNKIYGKGIADNHTPFDYGDGKGSAARFFYCAKASKSERNAGLKGLEEQLAGVRALRDGGRKSQLRSNNHPTVKPVALMEYLCKLTMTPTGGVVLDPFMGSGTTGVACAKVGRKFVGCEIDEGYFEIAEKRIRSACRRARSSFGIV